MDRIPRDSSAQKKTGMYQTVMKSKLSVLVALFGCLLFVSYVLYDYSNYGSGSLEHFFSLEHPLDAFFHIIIICTLIGSFITAYLIRNRKELLIRSRRSEQQLMHAADEWIATFDSMPHGVILTDNRCNIIKANKYILDLSGISPPGSIINRKCYHVVCREEQPIETCPIRSGPDLKKTVTHEYVDRKRKRIFSESITPTAGNGGRGAPTSYVHVLIDITDIKEKEHKLMRSKDAFFNMLKDLDSTNKELRELYNDLVVTLSNIIDAKSSWTRGHSTDVALYASEIAKEMRLDEQEIESLNTAALLHDIGKIGTYDVILDKPGMLSEEEFALIKKHTIKGEEILKPIRGLEEILPAIRSHHERVDGKGYPDKLKGEEIPLFARIISVADSYDAMISDRPYRPSLSADYAISEIRKCAGTQFDALVVDNFAKISRRLN